MDSMVQWKYTDRMNEYKSKACIFAVYETCFRSRDTHTQKVRGWEKVLHEMENKRKQE